MHYDAIESKSVHSNHPELSETLYFFRKKKSINKTISFEACLFGTI